MLFKVQEWHDYDGDRKMIISQQSEGRRYRLISSGRVDRIVVRNNNVGVAGRERDWGVSWNLIEDLGIWTQGFSASLTSQLS